MEQEKIIETLGQALDIIIDFARENGLDVHGTVAFSSEKETWVETLFFEKSSQRNHE